MLLMVLPDEIVEDELLARLRRGDKGAVIEAYEQYFPPLYQYAHLKTGDKTLAQDIVSEVFVRLIETLGKPSAPRESLGGWLFSVARHLIARTYGKNRKLVIADLEEWMPAPPESNPEIQLGSLMPTDRVRHALLMLTPDHQEVLILRFGQRLSLKETADIMGKSTSAIKSLQFRAVETLRGILIKPEADHG